MNKLEKIRKELEEIRKCKTELLKLRASTDETSTLRENFDIVWNKIKRLKENKTHKLSLSLEFTISNSIDAAPDANYLEWDKFSSVFLSEYIPTHCSELIKRNISLSIKSDDLDFSQKELIGANVINIVHHDDYFCLFVESDLELEREIGEKLFDLHSRLADLFNPD